MLFQWSGTESLTGTCNNVHWIRLRAIQAGQGPQARWDQGCPAGGKARASWWPVDANNNALTCLFNNANDGSGTFAIDCGFSQAAVQACIAHINVVDNVPNKYISVPQMEFNAIQITHMFLPAPPTVFFIHSFFLFLFYVHWGVLAQLL